jgi:hypothetical protein
MSRNRNKEEKKVIDATVIDEAILTYNYFIITEKPSRIILIKIKLFPDKILTLARSKFCRFLF